jgi:hypothetical protein
MQEYFLLIRNTRDRKSGWSESRHEEFLRACETYIGRLKSDMTLIAAQPLIPEGVMISGRAGAWNEGPFSDSTEVIVGYYHIRAGSLAEAVTAAKGNPEFTYSTTARIEVRPVRMKEQDTGFVYPA